MKLPHSRSYPDFTLNHFITFKQHWWLQLNLAIDYLAIYACLFYVQWFISKLIQLSRRYEIAKECSDAKKCIGIANFVNFSYEEKQDVLCQYKYCYCITKVQNGWHNLEYNKTSPKIVSNNITEINAHI